MSEAQPDASPAMEQPVAPVPDANLTAALTAINAEVTHQATAPVAAAKDFEAIVYNVFNQTCTNNPSFQGAQASAIVTQTFIPALIAALTKG